MKPSIHPPMIALVRVVFVLVLTTARLPSTEVDTEGQSSIELNLWFKLDPEGITRLLVLKSWARDVEQSLSETVFGVAVDYRISPSWALRAGVRRITQESDPSDGAETRAVLDAKYFLPLGDGWLLTDRNRAQLRWFEDSDFSVRLRNRVMIEKPFTIFTRDITAYASYELYYDTGDRAFSRQSLSVGFSVPLAKWAAADLFFTRDYAIDPPKDTVGTLGVAVSLTF